MISIDAILVKQFNQLHAGEQGRGKLLPWEGTGLQLDLDNDYLYSIYPMLVNDQRRKDKGIRGEGEANRSPGTKSLQLDLEKGKLCVQHWSDNKTKYMKKCIHPN